MRVGVLTREHTPPQTDNLPSSQSLVQFWDWGPIKIHGNLENETEVEKIAEADEEKKLRR